jgi:outer membrane lipoprotein-sorting protein
VRGDARLPERVELDGDKPVSVTLSHVAVHTRAELQKGKAGLSASLFEFTPPADADVVEPLFP